ncbi:MAG TPA: hypothetical protein VFW68_05450 [Rhodocyclaceae bacterium]|nr:hypothetical protein [Rhodocyclaceae bacterium]
MYLGDPYLAANVEATRVLITGGPVEGIELDYYRRLHQTTAVLNPCHEDNYYVANAFLAWAGSVDGANSVLRGATTCRFWDEFPPFYLGFNYYFFRRQHHAAKDMMFVAAARATDNRLAYERIGLMFEADSFPDAHVAQKYLISQRDQSQDQKLKKALDARIKRLDALIVLLDAQADFEKRFKRPLAAPDELIRYGLLKQYPTDPVGLGFVFENGRFALRELKVRGVEEPHQ